MKITLTDSQIEVEKGGTLQDVYVALLNAIVSSVGYATQDAPQEQKEEIYDELNNLFTAALESFLPDNTLRPDLDELAILNYQNDLVTKVAEFKTLQQDLAQDPELAQDVYAAGVYNGIEMCVAMLTDSTPVFRNLLSTNEQQTVQ